MACRAFALVLCLASANARIFLATDHGDRMRPEVVATTLARVEDEWKAQATSFAECHTGDCGSAPESFARSCSTVVSAVVQGSGGDRDVAREYMSNVCGQKKLEGWHKLRCNDLASAIVDKAMSADNYANRENLKPAKLCTGFWTKFVVEEQKREAEEAKAKAEREKKEAALRALAEKKAAEERAAREKKEAEEAAAAKKKAEEEAKAEAKKHAEEEAEHAQAEKERIAKEAAEKAKARAAEAAEKLQKKKEEAEAIQKAAQEKLAEAEKAEQEHKEQQAKLQQAEEAHKLATKAANSKDATKTTKEEAAKTTKVDAKDAKTTASAKTEKPAAAKAPPAPEAKKTPEAKKAPEAKKVESAVKSPEKSAKKF